MLTLTRSVRVYASATQVDMRKGFDGLSALVEQQFGDQLFNGDVFLMKLWRQGWELPALIAQSV